MQQEESMKTGKKETDEKKNKKNKVNTKSKDPKDEYFEIYDKILGFFTQYKTNGRKC